MSAADNNTLGQPIGFPIENWQPRPRPSRETMTGRYCRLEAINPSRHGAALYAAFRQNSDGGNWTYLGYGPFADSASFDAWFENVGKSNDPLFCAIVDNKTDRAVGVASYLRIEPAVGVIEVGHIHYSPAIQRTPIATETMYLMMKRVFDELGYRRYEWKCDSLNQPSRNAAVRLGFTYEGLFRQATIYKNRNRDTAWFSIIDKEWPDRKQAFEAWLSPDNFDAGGQQRASLASFRLSGEPRSVG